LSKLSEKIALRERALSLWCTGKYASKELAKQEARNQIEREKIKRKIANSEYQKTQITFTLPPPFTYDPNAQ